jgi:hypothetical protein
LLATNSSTCCADTIAQIDYDGDCDGNVSFGEFATKMIQVSNRASKGAP